MLYSNTLSKIVRYLGTRWEECLDQCGRGEWWGRWSPRPSAWGPGWCWTTPAPPSFAPLHCYLNPYGFRWFFTQNHAIPHGFPLSISEVSPNWRISIVLDKFALTTWYFLKTSCMILRNINRICSAQTRTGIGLLGKPPVVKQFPPSKAKRRRRLLHDPPAKAGMKRTSVVEHNLYFAGLGIVG